jgi:hypothetical protein
VPHQASHINSSRCGNLFNALGMRAIISSLRRSHNSLPRVYHASISHLSTLSNGPQRSLLHQSPHHATTHTLNACQHRLYHSNTDEPTIYALSTASGRAAIAVIRVSGSACRQVGAPSSYTPGILICCRYTKASVLPLPSQSLDTQPSASSIPRICLHRPRRSSTPVPSYYTFPRRTQSLAKMYSSCTYTAAQLLSRQCWQPYHNVRKY